jgi:hypothetical protein
MAEAAKATPPVIIQTKPGPVPGSQEIDHDKTLDPYANLDPDESLSEMNRVTSLMNTGQTAHAKTKKGEGHWAVYDL